MSALPHRAIPDARPEPADEPASPYWGERLGDFLSAPDALAGTAWSVDAPATTPAQAAAKTALAGALAAFAAAYGEDALAAQLRATQGLLQFTHRLQAIGRRVREARTAIDAEAAQARAEGDEALAREIEALPTPTYPGQAEDEAWLLAGRMDGASGISGRGDGEGGRG